MLRLSTECHVNRAQCADVAISNIAPVEEDLLKTVVLTASTGVHITDAHEAYRGPSVGIVTIIVQ
jgi:hypothetical protein